MDLTLQPRRSREPRGRLRSPALRLLGGVLALIALSGASCADTTRAARIGPGGGTVDLPGIASVTFPPGEVREARAVRVSATSSPETERDFQATAVEAFGAERLVPREIRIHTGAAAPSGPLRVAVRVSAEELRALPATREPQVFVQYWQAGGQEILDQFEPVGSEYDPATGTLTATLDPAAFTDQRHAEGTFEAVVVVGSIPLR